jgi:hypothetical protein
MQALASCSLDDNYYVLNLARKPAWFFPFRHRRYLVLFLADPLDRFLGHVE